MAREEEEEEEEGDNGLSRSWRPLARLHLLIGRPTGRPAERTTGSAELFAEKQSSSSAADVWTPSAGQSERAAFLPVGALIEL